MIDAMADSRIKPHLTSEAYEARKERLISIGEKLVDTPGDIAASELREITCELISIYDNPFDARTLRDRSSHVVSNLAKNYDLALDLVVESAHQYAENQHIDDAFPYNPNSFTVLGRSGISNAKVISFLTETVQNDWGIPRWEAIRTLCELTDPSADRIIAEIIQGKYPPRLLDSQFDLREIRQIKGHSFVEHNQS
jgi:hypothetical protein